VWERPLREPRRKCRRPMLGSMQASVHIFDEETGAGSVVLDDGHEEVFAAEVFARSGLRSLRVGQRVSIDVDDDTVIRVWVVGIGDGEPIH